VKNGPLVRQKTYKEKKKKSEAQQKKIKTVRGSYTDLDLSIYAKKNVKNLVTHSL
jgi:hypothetical protein